MKHHGHSLSGFRFQRYAWPANLSIGHGIGRKFAPDDLFKRYAVPAAEAQQFMGSPQGPYAIIELETKSANEPSAFGVCVMIALTVASTFLTL